MSSVHDVPLATWQDFLTRHAAGGVLSGRVTRVLPFGALVEVGDGIQGLLPKADWSAPPETGADIRVRIGSIDVDRRRMSLRQA
jgi:ribosomal protein S1